jgi:hypothetical protein
MAHRKLEDMLRQILQLLWRISEESQAAIRDTTYYFMQMMLDAPG